MGSLLRRDVIQAIQFFGRWIIHNPSHAARTAKIPVFGTGYLPLSSSFSFFMGKLGSCRGRDMFQTDQVLHLHFCGQKQEKKASSSYPPQSYGMGLRLLQVLFPHWNCGAR